MNETTVSEHVLARLEALTAKLDEQAARIVEQAATIVALGEEIARLKVPVPASGTSEAGSGPARTTTRRGLLTGALAAGMAATALAAAKVTPVHAADPNDVVKGITNSAGATTIISSGTVVAFAGYSSNIGVEGVGQFSGIGIRGSSNSGGGADFGGSGNGVEGRSGSGVGVRGQSDSSIGMYGTSGASVGVWGSSVNSLGVYGTSNSGRGVAGYSLTDIGVSGLSSSNNGVNGQSTSGVGVFGISTSGIGVQGRSENTFGILGSSTKSFGCGGSTSTAGTAGLFGYTSTPGAIGLQGIHAGTGGFAGFFTGDVYITGSLTVASGAKSAAVKKKDGSMARVYCQESPEPWFEDFGTAELKGGQAMVALDPEFDEVVKGDDYHVFLTPIGVACGSLYVERLAAHRFEVKSHAGATATGSFHYRVVARRAEAVGTRLEKVQVPSVDVEKLKRDIEASTAASAHPAPLKPPKP